MGNIGMKTIRDPYGLHIAQMRGFSSVNRLIREVAHRKAFDIPVYGNLEIRGASDYL